jgi:hypothetical protein
MLTGFNNNVTYKEDVFHVQTEDGGPNNPVITTHIYLKGAIMASEKYSYAHITNEENAQEKIMQLMESQHKQMIKSLLGGKFHP